jgi:hypothetical protein
MCVVQGVSSRAENPRGFPPFHTAANGGGVEGGKCYSRPGTDVPGYTHAAPRGLKPYPELMLLMSIFRANHLFWFDIPIKFFCCDIT